MKKGLDAFSYLQVGTTRIFVSYLILLPFAIKNLRFITKKNVGYLLLLGFVGNFIPSVFFTLAKTEITSSLAGILNGIAQFFVLTIGVIFFKNRPSIWQYIGIFVGFLGAFWLIVEGDFGSLGSVNKYVLLIVLATVMYGYSTNIIKYNLSGLTGVQITSLSFFLMGPVAGLILGFTDFKTPTMSPYFWQSLSAIVTLAVFCSVISLFVYYNLIHRAGPIFASSATYIVPFFAILWGTLDGETIHAIHFYSVLVILFGVYLSGLKRKQLWKNLKNTQL